ncbi:MAG: AAA family ATPase [Prevotella sp.]
MEALKSIAQSFAEEYCSDAIYPAHLFKAVLHKDVGLVKFIETDLDKDYYYLQDWADVQMQLAPRAAKPMRDLSLSDESLNVVDEAEEYKMKFGLDETNALCVLAALVTPGVGFSFDQLKTLPLTAAEISERMGAGADAATPCFEPTPGVAPKGSASGAEQYCIDKVKQAREGKLGVIVGFEKELETVFETLGRKTKSSLLVTGEAGVGKTALIEAFATRLADNKVPDFLKDAAALEIDLAAISADAQYKGEVENRFKNILKMMNDRRGSGSAVLIIEGLDKLFDKQGSLYGCSSMLKQELTRGQLQLLATSSIDGFTKNIETDKEMTSKLEKLTVEEPNADLCLDILKGALPAYEEFHGITIDEQVMTDAIRLAKRYLSEKALPDSAFDLIDRSMAALKIQNNKTEDESQRRQALATADMEAVVAKQTGIPLGKVQTSERDRLLGAEETLKERVIGQDHAIKKVLDSVFESRSGLNKKGQPMGSFFFLGPTGTGKTELSKALAAFLFGDESALVRFDMSEFKEEHSVALLYGAPPGYVGYEEGGLLVNKIRQNPYSVVLFDEIEKAHKSVFDLFLQILDEGKLHDRLGRVGDFSNALILFTSNIGSQYIAKKFQEGNIPTNTEMMDIMQQYFRPEFLARLTEIVPFSPITEQTVVKIFDIHLKGLLKLLGEQDIKLEMSDEVKAKIAMRGFDPQYGARQIIGNIRKDLRHPLSKLIIAGKVKGGDTVVVGVDGDELKFDIK